MLKALLFINLRNALLFILLTGSIAYLYVLMTIPSMGPKSVNSLRGGDDIRTLAPPSTSKRTAVIIITQMRSGSTFVGEMFNQHPDAFYIFEPLWALENHPNKTYNTPGLQLELVRGISGCKFEEIKDIMKFYLTTQGLGVMKTCKTVDNMCEEYRLKAQNVTLSKRCPIPHSILPNVLQATCQGKQFTAIKTIRLENITLLQPLAEQTDLDFKIIMLVRDPRAVIASRLALSKKKVSVMTVLHDKVDKNEVRELCDWMVRNAQPYKDKARWLGGRFAMVRYEDVAMEPMDTMKALYRYIGMLPKDEVSKWLESNTKTAKRRRDRENPFGTKKDPVKTSNEWRTRLTLTQVQIIQAHCKEAMDLFHYQVIKFKADMRNSSLNLYKKRYSLIH